MKSPKPIDYYLDLMTEKGLRKTTQKISLLKVMLNLKAPASAEQIHGKLKSESCDLVTVYRSLQQLEEKGLVQKSVFNKNVSLYSITPKEHNHIHHIQCLECEKLTEVDLCFLEAQTKLIEKMGFKKIKHRLEFFGVCPSCA